MENERRQNKQQEIIAAIHQLKNLGYRQCRIAAICGCSNATITRILNGEIQHSKYWIGTLLIDYINKQQYAVSRATMQHGRQSATLTRLSLPDQRRENPVSGE